MNIVEGYYKTAGHAAVSDTLAELSNMQERLDEKKGNISRGGRLFSGLCYLAGMAACVFFALQYGKIDFSVYTTATDDTVKFLFIGACSLTALFFFVLILKIQINAKYYKVIFGADKKIEWLHRNIQKNEDNREKRLKEFDASEKAGYDFELNIGQDVSQSLEEIDESLTRVGIKGKKQIEDILVAMYFLAGCAIGAVVAMFAQNACYDAVVEILSSFDVSDEWISNLQGMTVGIGAMGAIGGPIAAWHYFHNIRLVPVGDWLVLPALFSGIAGFLAAVIVFGLIAGAVALVIALVVFVVQLLLIIFGIIIGIAVVIGIISGG